jgi:hypothetical protein
MNAQPADSRPKRSRETRRWQRSCSRTSRRRHKDVCLSRPRRLECWKMPGVEALPQAGRIRRNVVLSLASGLDVAELDFLSSSPLTSVSAPWRGPSAERMPLRWLAETLPYWQNRAGHLASHFQAVFLSPRFDPLPPCIAVQEAVAAWINLCARLGLACWLQTRGVILPVVWRALREYAGFVRVTIALSTLDATLSRVLEPGTAPPLLRLRQLKRLRELGVPVQVTLAPLVPGVTDRAENLQPVLASLAELGISRATTGFLLLDPLAELGSHAGVCPADWLKPLEELYLAGSLRRWGASQLARCLPYRDRQRRYAVIMALAAQFGMEVRPNTLSDPDFRSGSAGGEQLALAWSASE